MSFNSHGQEELLAPYVDRYLDRRPHLGPAGHATGSGRPGVHLPAGAGLREALAKVDAWLREASASTPARSAWSTEGRSDMARALAAQAKDAERGLTL